MAYDRGTFLLCRCQGSQSLVTWVHAGHAVGGDNQLYTMISRAMGSPWAGTLKVSGIKLAKRGEKQASCACACMCIAARSISACEHHVHVQVQVYAYVY